MRVDELTHRLREKATSGMERFGVRLGVPELPGGNDFRGYLEAAACRFYRGVQVPRRDFVKREFPHWIDRAVLEADQLCRHEIELLGFGRVELGSEIDWHRDPITGRDWERRFWTSYRLENDPGGRDAKIIHELNRHQHLPRLAKAYHLTGSERYAAEAVAQIESWIDQNPVGIGVNWQSSLEIAIRAISWLWTMFLLLPSRSLGRESAKRIGACLFAQLEHVNRHTSLYSSPNTHLIGEAAALFIAGTVLGDPGGSALNKRTGPVAWRKRGAALLETEAEKQILDDGVYGELSSYYHCYALDFYLQALVLAQQNGSGFTDSVETRVCAMLEFLLHLTRPDGTIPGLGDDDGGRALALSSRDYRGFGDALCLGAVVFSRPDFKYCAGSFSEETLWLLGEEAWDQFHRIESRPPAETTALFPKAGYCTQRSGWGPLASHLVFDFGGLGMLTGGHSHADSLSVTLFGNGKDLLVDPGTYVYNGAPEWRDYFRSTPAHNTVAIDQCDQAEAGGAFRWSTRLASKITGASLARTSRAKAPRAKTLNDTVEYLEASHAGYMRLPQGVMHRRRVLQVPGEYWILADDVTGMGEHTCDFWYHFGAAVHSPDFENRDTRLTVWSASVGLLLGMVASGPFQAELMSGRQAPVGGPIPGPAGGWISRGYGHKSSSLSLRATLAGSVPAVALTVLAPMMARPVLNRLPLDDGDCLDRDCAVACSLQQGSVEDIMVSSEGKSELAVAGFRMKGEFFWIRMEHGEVRQTFAVRPAWLTRGNRDLLDRSHDPSGAISENPICAASAAF